MQSVTQKTLDVGLPAHEHSRQIAGVPGLLDEGVDLTLDGHYLQFRTLEDLDQETNSEGKN